MDVPYIGIVKSCDPREGLYVQFESYEDQEMLITNEVAHASARYLLTYLPTHPSTHARICVRACLLAYLLAPPRTTGAGGRTQGAASRPSAPSSDEGRGGAAVAY